jgi:hypothetical protein
MQIMNNVVSLWIVELDRNEKYLVCGKRDRSCAV